MDIQVVGGINLPVGIDRSQPGRTVVTVSYFIIEEAVGTQYHGYFAYAPELPGVCGASDKVLANARKELFDLVPDYLRMALENGGDAWLARLAAPTWTKLQDYVPVSPGAKVIEVAQLRATITILSPPLVVFQLLHTARL